MPCLATNGSFNTATGVYSLFSNSSGSFNSATGVYALTNNATGGYNTANGYGALSSNTGGEQNTATGSYALYHNTTGVTNTASGISALFSNTTGVANTASGAGALFSNTTGHNNTANGAGALFFNTTGNLNTATGDSALERNTTGDDKTANGASALFLNTTGEDNTANGGSALFSNTTGIRNTASDLAGLNLTTGGSNIDIGNPGVAGESATIRIGQSQTRTFIAGIRGKTTGNANAVAVLIDSAGQLGTISSSRRFKSEIKAMDNASEGIHALKSVTFRFKSDETGTPQFGLIAEEVAEVSSDLVVRDENGDIYTVRYEAVNAMLLNEFLKEHKAFLEQQRTVEELKKQVAALTAGLQKVSTQLELNKLAPQTVKNDD